MTTETPGAPDPDWRDTYQNLAIRAVLWTMLQLPYRWRVPAMGWIVSRIVAPIAGWNRRVTENLSRVCPELTADEIRRLRRKVPDNAGRALIETYSGREFSDHVRNTPLAGPGVAAFLEARAADRPVVLVTGHFGNYDAPRAVLFAQGHPLAGLYRPMRNPAFNAHYVRALSAIGTPVFPTDRKGILGFIKHLSLGGVVGILTDVHANAGAPLSFFGQPAPTALSAVEWALKYDALVVPVYGIRQPDGLSFEIRMEAPIPHGAPEEMGQALNDNLEALVRRYMDQWFWIHRRWAWKYQTTEQDAN